MNQRKASARYYGFEEILESTSGFAHLKARRSIAELQLLAGIVWLKEGARGSCPLVKPLPNGKTSRYLYEPGSGKAGDIGLVPRHRNTGSLLHEMAHALGPRDKLNHGPAFRARCLRFFKEYGDWSGIVAFDRAKNDY